MVGPDRAMHNIIIVFGMMGTGKTTYAKMLAKKLGYDYFSFDEMFKKAKWKPDDFLSNFKYAVCKLEKVVIDGWFAWDEKPVKSVEWINSFPHWDPTIDWRHVFAPMWMVEDRLKSKEPDIRGTLELSFRRTNPNNVTACKFIDSSDFEYVECTKKEYEERMSKTPTVTDVLKSIWQQEKYQNIDLGDGVNTGGYTSCTLSWSQIKSLVDWNGKTVLDIGCYWGYFCLQIKERGAREVTGTDIDDAALGTARMIRNLKKINVAYMKHDIEHDEIDREYDVILLLNTLHHLRCPFNALRKIFEKAKVAIFEIELPHDSYLRERPAVEMGEPIKLSGGAMGGHLRFSKDMMIKFALENNHFLVKETGSFRANRIILMFRRGL